MDPEENGEFKVGSNGTGAFSRRPMSARQRAQGPQGAATGAAGRTSTSSRSSISATIRRPQVAALASKQVDMIYQGRYLQLETIEKLPHVQIYRSTTAYTAVARVHPIKPFDDKRVRQALRYAIDSNAVLKVAHRGLGKPGEHHHVAPVHPEYANIGY